MDLPPAVPGSFIGAEELGSAVAVGMAEELESPAAGPGLPDTFVSLGGAFSLPFGFACCLELTLARKSRKGRWSCGAATRSICSDDSIMTTASDCLNLEHPSLVHALLLNGLRWLQCVHLQCEEDQFSEDALAG